MWTDTQSVVLQILAAQFTDQNQVKSTGINNSYSFQSSLTTLLSTYVFIPEHYTRVYLSHLYDALLQTRALLRSG